MGILNNHSSFSSLRHLELNFVNLAISLCLKLRSSIMVSTRYLLHF